MDIQGSIIQLKGVGDRKALVLKNEAGIETVEDLLYYVPRRYIDRSSFKLIKDCFVNEIVSVSGLIREVAITGFKKKRLEILIDDGSDILIGIFFARTDYFMKIFSINDRVIFSGKINFFKNKQIVHPEFDFIDTENDSTQSAVHTARIVPLYPSTEKLKQAGFDSRGFRRLMKHALDQFIHLINDSIDPGILKKYDLMKLGEAIPALHFPESFEHAERARRRLAFNEVFFLQYYLMLCRKHLRESLPRIEAITYDASLLRDFISTLPFPLTPDQEKAFTEIQRDLNQPFPMNRLVQGDVGSGKTVVAMGISLMVAGAGRQVAVMAPTEVLARQHYQSFTSLLPVGTRPEVITGSTPASEKKRIFGGLESGEIPIIIGTHALLQETVTFKDLALIIIDEQHRFGVNQRAALREKGNNAHLLVMTATPIPRSLSLTVYGDLDITSIKTKPLNRVPVKTLAFPQSRRDGVFRSMEKYISQGQQIFYVLPLIDESEKMDLRSAIETYDHLRAVPFAHRNVALLHGRMKQDEKDDIMARYKSGTTDILVSTTVIEVGIDVPNATVIVIEHAERFGLSQLHQLRGRVGRGEHQSFCVLLYPDDISEDSRKRIETLVMTDDGFAIAEEDLKLRGSGEIIGSRQHGHAGTFEFTNLVEDFGLIMKAREEAESVVSATVDLDGIFTEMRENRYSGLISGIRKKRILSILS